MDKQRKDELDRGQPADVERGSPSIGITARTEPQTVGREPSRSESRFSGHRPRSSSVDPGYISEIIEHNLGQFFKDSHMAMGKQVIKTIAEKFIQNSPAIAAASINPDGDEDSPYGRYTIDGKVIPGLFETYDVGFDDVTFKDPAAAQNIEDGVLEPYLRGTINVNGTDIPVLVTQADNSGMDLVVKKKLGSQMLIEMLFNAYNEKKNFSEANTFIQLGLKTSLGFHADMMCHLIFKVPGLLYSTVAVIIQLFTPILMITLLLFPDTSNILSTDIDDIGGRICPAQAGLLSSVVASATALTQGDTNAVASLASDTLQGRAWTIDMIMAKMVATCCMIVMLGSAYKAFDSSTSSAASYIQSYAFYQCCGYFDMVWSFVLSFIVIPAASYVVFIQEPDRADGVNGNKGHEVTMYMLMSLVAFEFLLMVPGYVTSLPGNDKSADASKHMIEYYLAYGEREVMGCCDWKVSRWILYGVQATLALTWVMMTFVCFDMKLDLYGAIETDILDQVAAAQAAG